MQTIPYVVKQQNGSDRVMDIFSRILEDRIILLNGPIDDTVSSIIVAQLLYLESENPDADITLMINSPGGIVTAGLSIYDTMQFIKCDVATYVTGQAASMGSLLAQAGAPGKRFLLPNSRTMIHQPSGGAQGQATDMQIHVDQILKLKKELTEIYVSHNSKKKKFKQLADDMERDNFMDAKEAVAYGLADKIISKRP